MPYSKRDVLAFCGRYTGLTQLLALLPKKPMLLALDYHRIGDAARTEYDAGVFSASAEALDEQVRFLKRRFQIVTLDEALDMIDTGHFRRTAVLLTFDDGYRDNYETAYPILDAHGVQGVFFLPTAFIGTSHVAPWDAMAFIVRQSRKRRFRLACAPLREFDIAADGVQAVIEQVLWLFKTGGETDAERFIGMLEDACDSARPDGSDRLFMSWEEAAAMRKGGMAMESHTHTHPALSQLEPAEMTREMTVSKQILEERLESPVRCLAYPFGLQESISEEVFETAERAGYRAGFSFFGGYNLAGNIQRFNVRRQSVCPEEANSFQLRTTLAAVMGRGRSGSDVMH